MSMLFGIVVATGAAAQAQDADSTSHAKQELAAKQKLDAVRGQIKALVDQQRATSGERDDAVASLRDKELALAAVARDVHALDDQLAAGQARLDTLNAQRTQLETALQSQRDALGALLRSAYALGHNEELKLLLQQDDVAAIARVLAYHHYFQRAQIGQIDKLQGDLKQLADVEDSIRTATRKLAATRAARGAEADKLQTERTERAALVARMDATLKDQGARIAALGKDESALTRLLEQLRDVFADIPRQLTGEQPFAASRGHLAWPLRGKILSAFGSVDESGRPDSGVLIAAKAGTPVHAISHGRVAFADWMRGYGMLLIIDHGDGYLSLYGCNETLLKSAGDWVNAGDTIATSGASGGQKTPGLYFEIRVKGHPVDPRGWLK
jgi:septal ring factor EnvC (AmiA/AmiB activator)